MLSDTQTSLDELKQTVREFVDQRDWQQFHSPKNLSMSLAIEAAELMEHFQWIDPDESRTPAEQQRTEIGEEMADVFCYLLAMANELDIDLASTFHRKMELNRIKYPADQYRGRFGVNAPAPVKNA